MIDKAHLCDQLLMYNLCIVSVVLADWDFGIW
jgi:hypothetical protein